MAIKADIFAPTITAIYAFLPLIMVAGLSMFPLTAIVIAIVATLSGMSQLGFMIALVHTALRDALTGCFSRLSGVELLEIQFIISIRNGSPLSIAFIDLDNFKSVNDTYGHETGDQTLVAAAECIRATLRTGDMLARWGGEEFILIMPNTLKNRFQPWRGCGSRRWDAP